jgi:type IV pilus assembly protein PilQ
MTTAYAKKKTVWLALGVLLSGLLLGCGDKKTLKKDPFFEKWKVMAEESRGSSPGLPDDRKESTPRQDTEVPEQETMAKPEKPLPTKKMSMKMHDVEVAVLLRTLARAANQNIVINKNVKGKANINIKEAPWDQVFRSVLSIHGLTYAWEGDIIRVITLEDINRDLELLNADLKKISARKEYDLGIQSMKARAEMLEPLVTRVFHIKYADPKTLRDNLWEFLRTGSVGSMWSWWGLDADKRVLGTTAKKGGVATPVRGAILVDPHTNSLMIQAVKGDIERLLPVIEELDRPTRQILIEAHIVEATRDTARELGIQWGGMYHNTRNDDGYWITPGGTEGLINDKGKWTYKPLGANGIAPQGFAVNLPADVSDGGASIGIMYGTPLGSILDMQLTALEEAGELNILSSPSVTTLDNQTATIESGQEVPIQKAGALGTVEIEYKKAALSLEVTPHVVDGRTLKLTIDTHKDELDFSSSVLGYPTVLTKNAETTVVVFDGQTTVIGGLSKETTNEVESGVPWFKDIPGLGWLFRGESRREQLQDLLIFITPHILKKEVEDQAPEQEQGQEQAPEQDQGQSNS